MATAAAQLKDLNAQLASINKMIRELKEEQGYDALKQQASQAKQQLYEYMVANGLDHYVSGSTTYKLSYVLPSDDKKQLRDDRKYEAIVTILTPLLPGNPTLLEPVVQQLLAVR